MKPKHIFCILAFLAMLLVPQVVALEISNSVSIVGTGTLDHEAEANTEQGYNGLKFSEYAYTQSLGLYGLSDINYTSNFDMIASDRSNSTINVDSAFELTKIRQMSCLRNYDLCLSNYSLLGRQSFFTKGDTTAVAIFAADNSSMSMDLAQQLEGAGGYTIKVLNSTNMHVKEYLDTSRYNGSYELVIGSFIGCDAFPASGLNGDWLICPSSVPTWHYETMEP